MKLSHLCVIGISALMICACSNRYSSPILVERGTAYDHDFEIDWQVIQEGLGIEKRLKDIFKQGYIEEGMPQDMVHLLWGSPDHESADGKVWEYYTREGKLITRLIWKKTDVPRLKGMEDEMVLEKIEGDRYGGSPAPTSKRSSNY
ncbi:MAG: hypothetical protein HUK20_07040 [Fibrobacter sp.]|nr:hypothetical protein [Fibrobacter sp.]